MSEHEDLIKAIEELKSEVKQLREIVSMLVDMVIDMDLEDEIDLEEAQAILEKEERDKHFSMSMYQ